MNKSELLDIMRDLAQVDELADKSPEYLVRVLTSVLLNQWDTIPEETRVMFAAVVGKLRQNYIDEVMADVYTEVTISKLRGIVPKVTLPNGKVATIVDHQFTVEVARDEECGMWIASCGEIGLFTEAKTEAELLTDKIVSC